MYAITLTPIAGCARMTRLATVEAEISDAGAVQLANGATAQGRQV